MLRKLMVVSVVVATALVFSCPPEDCHAAEDSLQSLAVEMSESGPSDRNTLNSESQLGTLNEPEARSYHTEQMEGCSYRWVSFEWCWEDVGCMRGITVKLVCDW